MEVIERCFVIVRPGIIGADVDAGVSAGTSGSGGGEGEETYGRVLIFGDYPNTSVRKLETV